MNDDQMREVVKECGLDWHRGYMPLFDSDPTNRYAVLIEAVVAAERERCAKLCESTYPEYKSEDKPCFDTPAECAAAIRGA